MMETFFIVAVIFIAIAAFVAVAVTLLLKSGNAHDKKMAREQEQLDRKNGKTSQAPPSGTTKDTKKRRRESSSGSNPTGSLSSSSFSAERPYCGGLVIPTYGRLMQEAGAGITGSHS